MNTMVQWGNLIMCIRKHGADLFFDSLEEMADSADIDAVYVASSNSLHAIQSIQMMKNGKHVLCERRIASNSKRISADESINDRKSGGAISSYAFNPALSNGALMDIGVYCVHPLAALFGRPEKILSSSLKLSNKVDAAGTILVEYGLQSAKSNSRGGRHDGNL
ncbi:MAG: Gfo/Idh/MocA family oxidoreductase [Clostridium sp.]|nr:Gfo/Idh/MocA family oxidoreductase [Clostridium sp.]